MNPTPPNSTPIADHKLQQFLRSKVSWRKAMERLAEKFMSSGPDEFHEECMAEKRSRKSSNLWIARASTERFQLPPSEIRTLGAIKKWWDGQSCAGGDIVVVSDKSISNRFFPFVPHPSNLVFPVMEMLHEGLERRGLRTDLTDLAGNPIHIVWGVLPMNSWVSGRARSRNEREIEWKASQCSGDLGNCAQLFANPKWIRKWLEPYLTHCSPRRRATAAEAREIREIRDRVLVHLNRNLASVIRANNGPTATSSDLFEIDRLTRLLGGIDLERERAVRLIGRLRGELGFARYSGVLHRSCEWLLPLVTMNGAQRAAFDALEFGEKWSLRGLAVKALIEGRRFGDWGGTQPLSFDAEFWREAQEAGYLDGTRSFTKLLSSERGDECPEGSAGEGADDCTCWCLEDQAPLRANRHPVLCFEPPYWTAA